ncbi:Morphology and auto-aggregation control protein [Hartmannibacter diazotrophicus]|uniref:Morphology and auto-aggregation control protein n=1 Tax=Hartmannibacter diazotrophicus TaxID=1482074 RepID=A0A2C9D1U3_9HYPH|nr:LysR family transcriptional regulator [Hartmannibacter diazotrophicus]SON54118.1 Morphology and auto-aggregation control protein [Hartmannibacter diazotrophicus]
MNLNQLRFVSALAQHGSFTKAASACAVTQPTLSNAIALLEEELGQKLFVRTTRKVTLTAFGANLLPDIERVIAAQQALVQRAAAFLSPQKRLIRIGTSPLLDARFLNLLIEPFRTAAPETDLIFYEMNMADLNRMLDKEELDFVFGVVEPQKEQRQSTFLYREPLLYVPRGKEKRPQQQDAVVRFDEIAGETFVLVPDACGLTRTIRHLFRSHRRALNEYSGEALSYQVLEQWAALGIGAAILPKSKLTADSDGGMRIIDKLGQEVLINFEAVWNRGSGRVGHLGEFAKYLREIVPAVANGLADRPKGGQLPS